jgi:zinc transport system substrate-binding protein
MRKIFVFGLLFLMVLAGCQAEKPEEDENLQIFVSILPQKFFVEQIAKDKAEVSVLVKPGAGPDNYEPTMAQVQNLNQASLYLRIGVPFEEAFLPKIKAQNQTLKIVDTREGIEIKDKDPHIWLSPELVKIQAQTITTALIDASPKDEEFFKSNLKQFLQEIEKNQQEIQAILKNAKNKKFLIFHPALSYFASEFNLTQIPIETEGKEPGIKELNRVIETARQEKIKIILVEPQFSQKKAKAIAEQINGQVREIDPLSEDYFNNLKKIAEVIAKPQPPQPGA